VKLPTEQTNVESLSEYGRDAIALLRSGNVRELGARLGYALAYDRNPADALLEDTGTCLGELGASRILGLAAGRAIVVKYFDPNNTGLFALVECSLVTDNGADALLELIVTADGRDRHISVEQLSV
jgi:hypothetical protein